MTEGAPIPNPQGKIDRLFELSENRGYGNPTPVTWNNLTGSIEMQEVTGARFARVFFPDVLLDIRLRQQTGKDEAIVVATKDSDGPVEHTRALSKEELVKVRAILDGLQVIAPAASHQ